MTPMQAIVRRDAGGWFIESGFAGWNLPERIINRYRILGAAPARGNYGPAPELAEGLVVDYITGSVFVCAAATKGKACRWRAYKDGAYLMLDVENECFEQVIEPVARPRVRNGIPVRWQYGVWEKYLKSRGWVQISA